MTRIEGLHRKAMLYRQAGGLLRDDAKQNDEKAHMIDGDLSDHEKDEICLRLKSLLFFIQNWTAETRLATMEAGR